MNRTHQLLLKINDIEIIGVSNNLIEIHYPNQIDLEMEQAVQIDRAIIKYTDGKPYYLLVNFRDAYGSMPSDVQTYFAREAPSVQNIIQSVIVLNNLPIRLLVKFFMRVFKPVYPVKILADCDLARDWIRDLEAGNDHLKRKRS